MMAHEGRQQPRMVDLLRRRRRHHLDTFLRTGRPASLMRLAGIPRRPAEGRLYAIVCVGRSGSTHLCDLLRNTDRCGYPREHLKTPLLEALKDSPIRLADVVEALLAHDATPNGVAGTKVVSRYLFEFLEAGLSRDGLDRYRESVRVIHLERRDTIARTTSAIRADRSRRWHNRPASAPAEAPTKLRFTEADVAEAVALHRDLERRDRIIAEHLRQLFRPEQVMPVTYEELIADPQPVLRRIIGHIGLDGAAPLRLRSGHQRMRALFDDDLDERLRAALDRSVVAA